MVENGFGFGVGGGGVWGSGTFDIHDSLFFCSYFLPPFFGISKGNSEEQTKKDEGKAKRYRRNNEGIILII